MATDPCDVKEIAFLTDGGDQDWSHSHDLLVYDQKDAAGIYQLHTIKPDGSEPRCLTCTARSGAPSHDRHKVNPVWHPSGRYIVLQGEMDHHPLNWLREQITSELFINGLWSNLYVTTADGSEWYRLTDYSSTKEDGPLQPRFSADGTKLLWSRLIARASDRAPFGAWRLLIADFVIDAKGVPSLHNIRDITPAGAVFVEPHGFSPDGGTIIFTGDMENTHKWGMDLWTMEVATGALRNLTKGPHWEEHASYSPSGRKIAFMSSEPYPGRIFQTEVLLVNGDGSGKRQVTHFNVPGHPESTEEQSMPVRISWNADGSGLAVTQMLAGQNLWKRKLWLVTFAGQCG